jgi:uncharacterized protein (AIM24 family)
MNQPVGQPPGVALIHEIRVLVCHDARSLWTKAQGPGSTVFVSQIVELETVELKRESNLRVRVDYGVFFTFI